MTEATKALHCILGQRKLHMEDLAHVRGHNAREEEVGNAVADGPAPVVVLGDPDTLFAVKDRLSALDIEPRKDAVVAIELMMTSSPELWSGLNDEAVRELMQAYQKRALVYMAGRFAPEGLVSMVWHLDEQTPHLHAVVLPIRRTVDRRRVDRAERWSLCARGDLLPKLPKAERVAAYASGWRGGVGGRGHMAYEQTRFAEAMAPLGLARGREWSGAPNKPNAVHQAEMREAVAAAQAEREGLGRDRADLATRLAAVAAHEAAAIKAREEAEADRVAAAEALREASAMQEGAWREADALRHARQDLDDREAFMEATLRMDDERLRERASAVDAAFVALAETEADALAARRALTLIGADDARTVEPRRLMQQLQISVSRASRDPGFAQSLSRARALAA